MAATRTAQVARPVSLTCHARRLDAQAAHLVACPHTAPKAASRRTSLRAVASPLSRMAAGRFPSASPPCACPKRCKKKEGSKQRGTAIRELGSGANGDRRPKKLPVRSHLPTVHDEITLEASLRSQSVMVMDENGTDIYSTVRSTEQI
jgi:hypothetical protein